MSPAAVAEDAFLTAPGWEGLAAAFDAQLGRGLHDGAQLCVRLRGAVMIERWGGFTDGGRKRRITRHTPFMAYSATKPYTAACVHRLAEEGRLGLGDPVARHWPAFGARGKEGITVLELLTHQAGIPAKATRSDALSWLFPPLAAARVAAMAPLHAPGEKTIYHAWTAGVALGELIRRLAGMSPAAYLRRHFLEPLGMGDSHAGLPFRLYPSASRIMCGDPEQASAAAVFSNPLFRRVFLPAASLNSTAADLCRFYAALAAGGTLEGRRVLKETTVREATAQRFDGPDAESGLRARWAAGFGLGGYSPFPGKDVRHFGRGATAATFGHSGQGGCAIGWADPASGLAFAFTCNRFLALEEAHARFQELSDAAWEAAGGR